MQPKQTQRNKILEILSDFKSHCLTNEMFCKDDRTRISELRKLGYIFDETLGNCQDLTHHHGSGLKLRKLINNPLTSNIPIPQVPKSVRIWQSQFKKVEDKQKALF